MLQIWKRSCKVVGVPVFLLVTRPKTSRNERMTPGPPRNQSNVTVKSVAASHAQIATQGVEVRRSLLAHMCISKGRNGFVGRSVGRLGNSSLSLKLL